MRRSLARSRLMPPVCSTSGLSSNEVIRQSRRYGNNRIVDDPPSSWAVVARDTARDPMLWFLLGTCAVFLLLGERAEAAVLGIAVLPIVAMDMYLHRRTRASTAGLSARLATTALVLRDGREQRVEATALVPGDIVRVSAGQAFPADGLVIAGSGLQVDESTLTGESIPNPKRVLGALPDTNGEIWLDGEFWVLAGTRLLTGEATCRLVYTGAETLYGQIVRSARSSAHEQTPLQMAVSALVAMLLVVAGILCLALATIRYYQGFGLVDALLSAVTLGVAALPEEFPVVLSVFLGVGIFRLARRQALVRRAVVVENIGRVSCICTDKTGTLTEGRLSLGHTCCSDGTNDSMLLRIAASACHAGTTDPLDRILLQLEQPLVGERLGIFPFTEDRRREVVVIRGEDGDLLAVAKGAPETVLAMTGLDQPGRSEWLERTARFAQSGHKVLACACCRLSDWSGGEPDRGYELSGLLAFEDAIRPGVREAVASALDAGIHVIMVTGDHPATASAIARELGIGGERPRVTEGEVLATRLAGSNGDDVLAIDVVARALPAHKLGLVKALQRAGEIVAVTGDGVNDVPALQGADIGIAMGEGGSRSAHEIAAIVLLDNNFRSIVGAIAEARQLFVNLKRSFAYLLMIHAPLVISAALIPLAGYPLLYLPTHIVWLELIIHPTALLAFQQLGGSQRLGPTARGKRIRFFSAREWLAIGAVAVAVTFLVIFGYAFSLGPDLDVLHARSMAITALVVAGATVTASLSGLQTMSARVTVVVGVLSALVLVQTPSLAELLHMNPLHWQDWSYAAAGGALAGLLALPLARSHSRQDRHDAGGTSR
ncbi:MAG: cation-transporting P-type ATPase [Gammaproteobacteria bacterium]|nr:cation-transporting P-type ATPase [Gammaproteobacteria bacterium]